MHALCVLTPEVSGMHIHSSKYAYGKVCARARENAAISCTRLVQMRSTHARIGSRLQALAHTHTHKHTHWLAHSIYTYLLFKQPSNSSISSTQHAARRLGAANSICTLDTGANMRPSYLSPCSLRVGRFFRRSTIICLAAWHGWWHKRTSQSVSPCNRLQTLAVEWLVSDCCYDF